MNSANFYRCGALCLALWLTPSLSMAQQAVNPKVFIALQSAEKAQQNGDLTRAGAVLQEVLAGAESGSLELALIQQRLGYLAIATQQNTKAIDWLSKSLAHGKLEEQAARQDRLNLAQLLAAEGRYRDAVKLLEREQAAGGLSLEQKRLLVQCYSQLKDYGKAIPMAEQVVRTDADAEDVWYQLLVGMNYQLERYDSAAQWQKILLKRNPQNPDHWRQLAGLQSQAGKQRAAAATLRLAHAGGFGLNQTDLDNLVALQVNAGAPWQAARLLEALIAQKLLPANAVRNERLAQLWTLARDRERAQAAWVAVASGSDSAEHWLRLAGIQLEEGDWPALLATLKRAEPGASNQQRQLIREWEGYAKSVTENNS